MEKGIPSLVIAASSIHNVIAITGFGVAFGITFSQGNLALKILSGPFQVIGGVVWGVVVGGTLWYFPANSSTSVVSLRCALLGIVKLFVFDSMNIDR